MVINRKNAMKSMFARFENIKNNKVDADEFMPINDVESSLQRVGIKLRDSKNSFRDLQDVIDDVGKSWSTYDDVTKQNLATSIAGSRQKEYFTALMSNYSKSVDLATKAEESNGLAQERMATYTESTEAKFAKLKNSMQELYTTIINSGVIQGVLDITTNIVKLVNSLGGVLPVLTEIFGVIMMIKGAKILEAVTKSSIFTALSSGVTWITNLGSAMALTMKQGASLKDVMLLVGSNIKTSATNAIAGASSFKLLASGIGITIVALGAIYMAYQKNKKEHEEYIQTLEKERDSLMESADSISELTTKYKELATKTNRTGEDNKQLLSLQDELIDKFGMKKDAIDLVNGSLDDNLKAIENIKKENIADAISKQIDIISDAYDKLEQGNKRWFDIGTNNTSFSLSGLGDIKQHKEMANYIKKLKDEYGDALKLDFISSGIVNGFEFDKNKMSQEEYIEALKNTRKELQQEYGDTLKNTEAYKYFSQQIEKEITLYDNLNSEKEKMIDLKKQEIILNNKNLSDIENNTDIDSLNSLQTSLEKQIIVSADTEKVEALKELLSEVQTQIEYINNNTEPIEVQTDPTPIESLTSKLDELSKGEDLNDEDSSALSDALKSLSENGTLTSKSIETLKNLFPELASYISKCKNEIFDFNDALDTVQDTVKNYSSNMDKLDDAISKISKGKQLKGSDIQDLIREYPQLNDAITENNGVYSIELTALQNVRDELGKTTKEQINGELEKTKVALESSHARVTAYLDELKYANEMKNVLYNDDGTIGYSGSSNDVKNAIDDYNEKLKTYNSMKAELDSLSYLGQDGDSSSSSTKYASYIEQGLDDIVDVYKDGIDKISNEKDKLEKVLSFNNLKYGENSSQSSEIRKQIMAKTEDMKKAYEEANKALIPEKEKLFKQLQSQGFANDLSSADDLTNVKIDEYKRKLEKQKQDLELNNVDNVNDEVINKLENVTSKFNEEASAIITINNAITENSSAWWDANSEYTQEFIDQINEATNELEDTFSDKASTRDLISLTFDEDDEDYFEKVEEMLKEQIDEKYQLEEASMKAYLQLTDKGFTEEAKNAKQKWESYEKERFDLAKQEIENEIKLQQKQFDNLSDFQSKVIDYLKEQDDLQKENLNKQKDAINNEADAKKDALESRKNELSLVKDEYDKQKKIADLRKSLANTMSDLNALEYDSSAEAIQSKIDLANQLQSDKDSLAEELLNQAIEDATTAIDNEITAIENDTKARTDAIDKMIEAIDNKKDRDYQTEANQLISNDNGKGELYQKMLDYYTNNGTGTTTELTESWDKVKDTLTSLDLTTINLQNFLQKLSDSIYVSQKSENDLSINTIDGKTVGGETSVQSSIETSNKLINDTLLPLIQKNEEQLSQSLNIKPTDITNAPQFVMQVDGSVDNKTLTEAKNWFLSNGVKFVEQWIEPYLQLSKTNIVGRTK